MTPLTTRELRAMKCPCCDGGGHGVILKSLCHPQAGIEVEFVHMSGVLRITCRKCSDFVCDIKVAPPPTSILTSPSSQ